MPRLKKLASLIFATVVLVTLVAGVTPIVSADQDGDEDSFDILVFENGNWQLEGELSFSDYETLQLPLDNNAGQLTIRLVQHGHDAAYVDYVALRRDSATYLPTGAVNVNSNINVLNKIISPEYDVCDAWDSTLEIAWDDVPANGTLVMRAMQEDLGVAHGGPLYHPNIHRGEALSYTLVNDGGITVDGVLEETTEPDFSVFWQPDSPHPDGYTYGWLHCDQDYLYAAAEVTADNTPDEEDWGALYVMVNGELKEFRISCDDSQWGANGFQYTSSVTYEHRIYEFRLPLSEINIHIGDEIDYGFGCYGTVAIRPDEVWVDDSWSGQADVNLFDPGLTWQYDAFNVTQDGIDAVHEDGTVHVRPGKYDEHLVVGNKSLTLQSTDGWQETTIDPDGHIIFIWGDADVTVQGFEITGGCWGIYITDVCSTVNIRDCFIHDNTGDGIHVAGGGDLLHIEGNKIAQNGGCGINMTQAWNTTNIFDNVIGAWTYYPEDYGGTDDPQRYGGNGSEGIHISDVGQTATVVIQHNRISENALVVEDTGISIGMINGVMTIAHNDIGAWEDSHGEDYLGNVDQGITISSVLAGAELTIGPDNGIKGNSGHGIDILWAQLDSSIDIHHNVVDDNGPWACGSGVKLGSGGVCGAMVRNNIITNNHKGIYLDEYSTQNTIQDNLIMNNGHGVWIEGDSNQILRNEILNNMEVTSGIHLTSYASNNTIHCNNIIGNLPYGVYNGASEVVNATKNWWGHVSGPSGVGLGSGDAVSANVTFDPWLPTEFQYCPECGAIAAVGGEAYPVSKLGILAPWIVFCAAIIAGIAILARRRRAGN
jgi:parallel beta-helix repeat protein